MSCFQGMIFVGMFYFDTRLYSFSVASTVRSQLNCSRILGFGWRGCAVCPADVWLGGKPSNQALLCLEADADILFDAVMIM